MISKSSVLSLRVLAVAGIAGLATTSSALAGGGDVGFWLDGSQITTRTYDHDNLTMLGASRVFLGDLSYFAATGTDPESIFGDEPGWGALGANFTTTATLNITVRSSLKFFDGSGWNGTSFNAPTFAATSTRLRIADDLGAFDITTPASDPIDPSAVDPARTFSLDLVGGQNYHKHIPYFLDDSAGGPLSGIAEGFYLLEFDISASNLSRSLPFWIVFKYGESFSEEQHEAIEEWVEENIVPTPASAGLIALGGLLASRRRRA